MKSLLTIFIMGACTLMYGQSQTVSGVVSDNDGSGLPGVSVKLRELQLELSLMETVNILLILMPMEHWFFHLVGYKTQEIAIEGKTFKCYNV